MFILKLIFKNAFRHRMRALMTVSGITLAVLAFGLLQTVVHAWYAGVAAASATRLVTRNSISLVFSLPVSYREKIRAVPGVTHVAGGTWFGGVYVDEKNFFPNFAVQFDSYLPLFPEFVFDQDELTTLLKDRGGCAVGRKLAARFGWKVGDRIPLRGTIFPGEWNFVLRAVYRGANKNVDESQLLFHWDYLNETMRKTMPRRADNVGFFMVGITNPELASEVSDAIDTTFANSLAETLTETEKAFNLGFVTMSDAIISAIQIVSYLVVAIIMAVAANTMAMTARERLCEYAVFKALGFGSGFLGLMILGESLVISLSGGLLGAWLTFPAAQAFGAAMSDFMPIFNVAPETIWIQLALSLAVGLAAAAFPAARSGRIGIAEGLRRIA
jgi:putative ABC transport system permease protein